MKHTKGEWRFVKGEVSNNIKNKNFLGSIMTLNGEYDWHICAVWNDIEEAEANAKLIAAAPELLEALIVAQNAISAFVLSTPTSDLRNDLTDINIKVLAAIQKATLKNS